MNTRRNKQLAAVLTMAVFIFQLNFGFLSDVKFANAAIANHVVINEVHIDGVEGSGGTEDDWVELYNPTDNVVSVEGWSVQKTAGSGSSLFRQPLVGSIEAENYLLIVRDGSATTPSLKEQADILASNSFSLASGNIIYLVNNNENIEDSSDINIIDLVGFGDATIYEGVAQAPEVLETKSISRLPNGEDTDENSVDFVLMDAPTPTNFQIVDNNNVSGNVLLTIAKNLEPVQSITPTSANIVFQINADGSAVVNYGLDTNYAQTSLSETMIANTDVQYSITGLECGQVYHYNIVAESTAGTESDQTSDDIFETLPCGITLDSLAMTKSSAKANNQYSDGWIWEFDLTVWNMQEDSLKMKFNSWNGSGILNAAGNMQFSADNGFTWYEIENNNEYPLIGADLTGVDLSLDAGRQVKILVRMKIPQSTLAGNYTSDYGILTE